MMNQIELTQKLEKKNNGNTCTVYSVWISDTLCDTLNQIQTRIHKAWINSMNQIINCSLNDSHQSLFMNAMCSVFINNTQCDPWLFIWLIPCTDSLTHLLFLNRSDGEPVAWWWRETASSSSPSSVSSWCSAAAMTSVGSSGKAVTKEGLPDWE